MIRIFLSLLLILWTIPGWAQQWNPLKPLAGDNPVNYPTDSQANNNSLQRLLANYRQGAYLTYNNASSINILAGEVSCNSTTPYVYRQNVSTVVANTSNLDTGNSFSASTNYYIYASCDAAATTFAVVLSLNASTPSGVTNYKLLGYFITDSATNIAQIIDNAVVSRVGPIVTSYSSNNAYQATTDGQLTVCGSCEGNGGNPHYSYNIYSDASPNPSQSMGGCDSSSSTTEVNECSYPIIRKGNYWKVTYTSANPSIIWTPLGQ